MRNFRVGAVAVLEVKCNSLYDARNNGEVPFSGSVMIISFFALTSSRQLSIFKTLK